MTKFSNNTWSYDSCYYKTDSTNDYIINTYLWPALTAEVSKCMLDLYFIGPDCCLALGRRVCLVSIRISPLHSGPACCLTGSFLRCLLLWSLHYYYICECWPGGDRKPDPSLSVRMSAELHGTGVPLQSPVHHGAPSLHREPTHSGICSQILSIQGRCTECVFCSLHSGTCWRVIRVRIHENTWTVSRYVYFVWCFGLGLDL